MTEQQARLVERTRQACLDAARLGYQDASLSGLCAEGALEAALSAIEMLDLSTLAVDAEEG